MLKLADRAWPAPRGEDAPTAMAGWRSGRIPGKFIPSLPSANLKRFTEIVSRHMGCLKDVLR